MKKGIVSNAIDAKVEKMVSVENVHGYYEASHLDALEAKLESLYLADHKSSDKHLAPPKIASYISYMVGVDKIKKGTVLQIPDGVTTTIEKSIQFMTTPSGHIHPFIKGDKLAENSKTKIRRAVDLVTNEEVVLKVGLQYPSYSKDPEAERAAKQRESEREKRALLLFNQLKAIGAQKTKATPHVIKDYLVQEMAKGDNAETFLAKKLELLSTLNLKDLDKLLLHFSDVLSVAVKFCEKFEALNAAGYLHRDIKPGNVMVNNEDEGLSLKIIDFGGFITLAEGKTDPDKDYGTQQFMAPELPGEFSLATEAYAVGISLTQFIEVLENNKFKFLLTKNPACKEALAELKRMSVGLIQVDPQQRLSLKNVLSVFNHFIKENSVALGLTFSSKNTTSFNM